MGERYDARWRTPPREFTSRGSVPLRGGDATALTHPRRIQTSCRQRNRIIGDSPLSIPMRPWPTDTEGLSAQRSGAPDRAYLLLCECSYKVRCEVMRHGERLGELTFF